MLMGGKTAEAGRLIDNAAVIADKTGSKTLSAGVAMARGDLLRHLGDEAGAAEWYGRSAEVYRAMGFSLDEARATYSRGQALERSDVSGRAEIESATAIFRAKGVPLPEHQR
jgi:hypothetical protein